MPYDQTYSLAAKTPLGWILLEADDSDLLRASFLEKLPVNSKEKNPLLTEAEQQLNDYFEGKRKDWDLPFRPEGTDFQKRVWKELQQIPYGQTITYLQLAKRLGNIKCIRAAAAANGKNPLAIFIPCHRVIGIKGSLTGYVGGLYRKKWLLDHEAKRTGNGILF